MSNPPPPPPGGYPPPPPSGGYPPPPPYYGPAPSQGGYPPPPPPGAWGPPFQPGGYPPQGAWGPPPGPYGGGRQLDIGATFSWAWNKFSKNAVALIVPTLLYVVIVAVVSGIFYGLAVAAVPTRVSSSSSGDPAGLPIASIALLLLGGLVNCVVVGAISSAYYAGLLDIANGQQVSIGSFVTPRHVGRVLVASLLIGVVSTLLSFCFILSIVIGLFTLFATVLIVDRNLAPIEAIKTSVQMATSNFVQVLLAWLIIGVIAVVGALACGIGLVVAVPVAALFLVHTYRTLGGGEVAPLTP